MSIKKGSYVIAGTPRTTGGVEIGDVGIAPFGIDESLNLRRYLNGQVISQSQFTSFTNKVKATAALYPSIATTETNWQAEKTNSKLGQCGKFVVDDTAGTIRLPCVVNAQGLVDLALIGGIKNESLPNITGSLAITSAQGFRNETGVFSGAFKNGNALSASSAGEGVAGCKADFDASGSSSTYQDNAPVQQEAVQYPYYIQVATGVEETLPAIREYQVNNSDFFGQSMYSDVVPDNASWLVSNGQWNAKSVYPDYYDWLNGKIGQVITANGGKVVLSTDTITDYDFVVNQNDQTFRLPLLNGEEDIPGTEITYSIFSEITTTAQTYTCPTNGFIFVDCGHNAGTLVVTRNYSGVSLNGTGTSDNRESAYFFAKKGDVISVALNAGTQNLTTSYFLKATGNGSLYYYVGDTVQDASLINAGAVLGQLATKTNSVEAAAASMPSGRYIDLTLGASGTQYTAPANGYVVLEMVGTQKEQGGYINSPSNFHGTYYGGYTPDSGRFGFSIIYPVTRGEVFTVVYSYTEQALFGFFYAEGEN